MEFTVCQRNTWMNITHAVGYIPVGSTVKERNEAWRERSGKSCRGEVNKQNEPGRAFWVEEMLHTRPPSLQM